MIGILSESRDVRSNPEFYSAIAGLLSIVFGTSAAIAGAVATVRLAALALDVSTRQESRETRSFVEERVTTSTNILTIVAAELAAVAAAGTAVYFRVNDLINDAPDPRKRMSELISQDVSGPVLDSSRNFCEALRGLSAALRSVQLNGLARRCFVRQLAEADSALGFITKRGLEYGLVRGELIAHDDIASMVQLIDIAISRLKEPTFSELIEAHLLAWLPNQNSVSAGYSSGALRTFMFQGHLILTRTELEAKYTAAIGAAILSDIFFSLPDTASIKKLMQETYPESVLQGAIRETLIDFVPESIVGAHFAQGARELAEHKELLLLPLS